MSLTKFLHPTSFRILASEGRLPIDREGPSDAKSPLSRVLSSNLRGYYLTLIHLPEANHRALRPGLFSSGPARPAHNSHVADGYGFPKLPGRASLSKSLTFTLTLCVFVGVAIIVHLSAL